MEQATKLPGIFFFSFRFQLARGEGTPPASPTRADLDRELEAIRRTPDAIATHELARQMRSHLNRLSLFHRLPTEMISAIFCFAQSCARPDEQVVRIASVSRLWREIATQMCSTLWATLDTLPIPLISIFLSRSEPAPLEIIFDTSTTPTRVDILEFFELVVPHIHRWRVCRIVHNKLEENKQDVLSLLQQTAAAPHLEVLQLNFLDGTQPHVIPFELSHPFSGIAPRLHTINCDIHISLSSQILRGLAKLHLSKIVYTEPTELLRALELCPLLESISFLWLQFRSIPIARAPDPVIALRHLQVLHIEELWQAQWVRLRLLPCIIVPASCNLCIKAHVRSNGDLRHLLPRRSNFLPNLPDIQSVRMLHISCDADVCILRVCGYIFEARDAEAFSFTMIWGDVPHDNVFPRVLSSIVREFPLPLIEEVYFWWMGGHHDSDLLASVESFLRVHPTLKNITFAGCWPWDRILEILVVTPTRHLCPLLEELSLICNSPNWDAGERALLELVKSRTAPMPGHLASMVPLQRLFFGSPCARPSASTLLKLQTYVTAGSKLYDL
ncbi:hypothetical protein BOTBODRAFT_36946 [Botryobasidium botryosum FD-172 SS1]|uniref:Uncharacterized protein n=1 Tax=Botryobasidium botryosum (strain FD-172 SS1) TaxID=930990 RepID=A0A067MD73_BOTB1|nr:hypothetical protein BOTBODRAFT_36946 [Botryobasidium botryosum FD-172 SS1]